MTRVPARSSQRIRAVGLRQTSSTKARIRPCRVAMARPPSRRSPADVIDWHAAHALHQPVAVVDSREKRILIDDGWRLDAMSRLTVAEVALLKLLGVVGAARLECGEPAAEAGKLIRRQPGNSFGDLFKFHVAQ